MLILNSYHGKVLESLIELSLREARIRSNYKWNEETKDFFTQELKKSNHNHYSKYIFSILGMYLPQFIYLDKDWVFDNFNKIFDLEISNFWECSTYCYFKRLTRFDVRIYDKLKEGNHLKEIFKDKPYKKAVDIVIITYMNSHDKFLLEILNNQEEEFYERLSWFVERNYKEDSRYCEKIKTLIKNINNKNLKYFSNWITFFDSLDDEFLEIFKVAFKNRDPKYGFRDSKTLENFIKISEKSADKISELYLEMVREGIIFIFPDKKVRDFFEKLKEKGEKNNLVTILKIYSKNGYYNFNDIVKDLG